MGIRIVKCVGYGFDNLVENDPRIDLGIYQERFEDEKEQFDAYLNLVKDRSDTEFMLYEVIDRQKKAKWSLCDKVVYDTEFGLDRVMLFIHPSADDWYRYDDIIDFCDGLEDGVDVIKARRLSRGIYPYNQHDEVYHIPTGKTVNGRAMDYAKYAQTEQIVSTDGTKIDYYDGMIGDCLPAVPTLIKHLAMYMGVNPLHINELRPLSYTLWR